MVLALVSALMTGLAQDAGKGPSDDGIPAVIRDVEEIEFKHASFTFVRINYSEGRGPWNARGGRGRGSWSTDYPEADLNFSARFQEVTGLKVDTNGLVLKLTDERLGQYPFIYMAEGGQLHLGPMEVERLRDYLLGGGFLMVDDFWGEAEWNALAAEFRKVFPDREPVELPIDHAIFRCFYEIGEKPQVPNVGQGMQSQFTGVTWERDDAREAHYRGLMDDEGRLMAVFCHNTDLGDGWERTDVNGYYHREFSLKKAFPMGINIVIHALSE
jgi:hypothetical protein